MKKRPSIEGRCNVQEDYFVSFESVITGGI